LCVLFGQEQAGLEWDHSAKEKLIALLPGNVAPDCPTDWSVVEPSDFAANRLSKQWISSRD